MLLLKSVCFSYNKPSSNLLKLIVGLVFHKAKPYHYFVTCHNASVHLIWGVCIAACDSLDTAHKSDELGRGTEERHKVIHSTENCQDTIKKKQNNIPSKVPCNMEQDNQKVQILDLVTKVELPSVEQGNKAVVRISSLYIESNFKPSKSARFKITFKLIQKLCRSILLSVQEWSSQQGLEIKNFSLRIGKECN